MIRATVRNPVNHCMWESELNAVERFRRTEGYLQTSLCGKMFSEDVEVRKNMMNHSIFFVDEFMEKDHKCPECEDHPDLAMLLLGDLP